MKKILPVFFLLLFIFSPAQIDTVFVYGPGGPAPAIKEIASHYNKKAASFVKVTAGPTPQWKNQAMQNAHVIYSGSEHMMTDFAQMMTQNALQMRTVYPLYKRQLGLLVRPGNPKKIKNIQDLAQPGLKIMVVQGSGLTGAWEDMLSHLPMKSFRAVRANITDFAANSGLAEKEWANGNADVWITWNIWQTRNRDAADFVHLPKRHRIYRDTGAALTEQGADHAAAKQFYEYLKSAEAKAVFLKWGWE